jgi:Tol biopolymer transport system component
MIGTTISHYKILENLGGGGMGVVFKAEDLTLGRPVALKFLPDSLAEDPEAMRRFQREARAASALNHPHICTIHALGEENGRSFIVMELMDGETLEQRLQGQPLPVDEIVRLGIQVADALEAAHGAGIVHRDIKPANILVTRRGDAKVLDFGLAKVTGARTRAESAKSAAATELARKDLTTPGTAMGTIAYMSPEQVRGEGLDERTDLFSLGVVLYELATGKPPFSGTTTGVVFDQILNRTPSAPVRLNPDLPDELGHVLDKCLEKDSDLRYQSARELMADLKRLRRDSSTGVSTAQPISRTERPGRKRLLWIPIALLLLVAAALGGWYLTARHSQRMAEPLEITPFTNDGGWKEWPQLSPDGEKVAYVWYREGAVSGDIYVKALGLGTRPLPLTASPASEISPVWSPDGREIAFTRAGERGFAIYLVPALGGQERKLVDVAGPAESESGYALPALAWSPDGRSLAFPEMGAEGEPAQIVRLSLDSLEKTKLTSPPENTLGDFFPAFSPDGEQLAFLRSGAASWGDLDVWVQPLEGGQARRLTFGKYDNAVAVSWTPGSDEIVFSTGIWGGGSIHRVSLDGGGPRGIPGIGENTAFFTVRGSRIVFQQRHSLAPSIWRVPGRKAPTADRVPQLFAGSMWIDYTPAYSPDGRKVAFQSYRSGHANIWLCDHDGSNLVQLTRFTSHTGTPRWSPDGRRIVFDSLESGNWDVWEVDVEGGVPRQLTTDPAEDGTPFWSRDGRWIYFHSNRSGRSEIWKLAADGGETVQVTDEGGFYAEESWDGESLYYTRAHSGGGIWRKPLVGSGADREVVAGPVPNWGDWAVAKAGIYFSTSESVSEYFSIYRIHFFDFANGEVTEILRRDGAYDQMFLAVSPDEDWLLFGESPVGLAELMLAENFR